MWYLLLAGSWMSSRHAGRDRLVVCWPFSWPSVSLTLASVINHLQWLFQWTSRTFWSRTYIIFSENIRFFSKIYICSAWLHGLVWGTVLLQLGTLCSWHWDLALFSSKVKRSSGWPEELPSPSVSSLSSLPEYFALHSSSLAGKRQEITSQFFFGFWVILWPDVSCQQSGAFCSITIY